MSLDTLLNSFEFEDSEDSCEGGDEILSALPELRKNQFRLSQLPAPPPPIVEENKVVNMPSRKPTIIERSISGSFKKFGFDDNDNRDNTEKQRLLVLQEIIVSEQDYVKDVAYVVQGFLQPLRAANVCSPDVPVIFGNIELIYSINTDLLTKLNEKLEKGSVDGTFVVGEIFIEMANNLLSYDQYCTNHEKAAERLQKCLKQNLFLSEVEKCRNRMVGTGKLLHLPDLLIKPIQRICKYPLLLKELLKYTHNNHPDHFPLLNAIEKLESITNKINNNKREVENMQTLTTIQKQLDGLDVKLAEPGRFFSREGTLQKINPRGKIQSRHFILLSDMLIWCKSKNGISIKKNHFQYKGMIRLDLAVVRDTHDSKSHKFQIIKLDTKKIYNLVAESAESKRSWIESIDKLINIWLEVEKNNQQAQKTLLTQESSPSILMKNEIMNSKLSPSPLIARRQTTIPNAVQESPTPKSPLAKPNQQQKQRIVIPKSKKPQPPNDFGLRLKTLEEKLALVLADNQELKTKITTLETTVTKQGREIRKLRKKNVNQDKKKLIKKKKKNNKKKPNK